MLNGKPRLLYTGLRLLLLAKSTTSILLEIRCLKKIPFWNWTLTKVLTHISKIRRYFVL